MATYDPAGMHPTQVHAQWYYSTLTDTDTDVLSAGYFNGVEAQTIDGRLIQLNDTLAYKAADRVLRHASFTDLTPGNVVVTPG